MHLLPFFFFIFFSFSSFSWAANCNPNAADSTCFSQPNTQFCGTSTVQKPTQCPSGLSGTGLTQGTRNLCTGSISWISNTQDLKGCTNCTTPLSDDETKSVQNAILEALEDVNIAFNNYACPGFSCLDGTLIINPLTNLPSGVSFRDHVWVPDAFSTGLLPTTNRVRYLGDNNLIYSFVPPIDLLPKDSDGNPQNDTRALYLLAYSSANDGGYTQCTGDGTNGCNVGCTTPTEGFMDQFCTIKTVQYYVCSDGPAVFDGVSSTWKPTSSAIVPYTQHNDYTMKQWDWDTIFDWNGLPPEGGSVYMCKTTLQSCKGWETTNVFYACKTPGSGPCPLDNTQTCSSCAYPNAQWDWNLYQVNDCPITKSSTRTANNRLIWQSDYPSQCNQNPLSVPTTPGNCPTGLVLDSTGTACTCPNGYRLDTNGQCIFDSSAGLTTYTSTQAYLAQNYPSQDVLIGSLADTSKIINNVQLIGGQLPLGIQLTFLNNTVMIEGTPTNASSKAFTGSILISYNAGTTSTGVIYPAGSVIGNFSISVSKFTLPCVITHRNILKTSAIDYSPFDFGSNPKTYTENIGDFYSCSGISNFTCKTQRTQYVLSADLKFQCNCASGFTYNGTTCALN